MTFNSVSPPINTGGFKPDSSIDLMILGIPRPQFSMYFRYRNFNAVSIYIGSVRD